MDDLPSSQLEVPIYSHMSGLYVFCRTDFPITLSSLKMQQVHIRN